MRWGEQTRADPALPGDNCSLAPSCLVDSPRSVATTAVISTPSSNSEPEKAKHATSQQADACSPQEHRPPFPAHGGSGPRAPGPLPGRPHRPTAHTGASP